MRQRHFSPPDTARGCARPKLDLRLVTLVELGMEAYGERPDFLERARGGFRRRGPLSFLAGGRRDGGSESSAPPVVQVFVTVSDPAAFEQLDRDLRQHGGAILSRARTVATAHLPLSRLALLEDRDDVVAVEWSGAFRPLAQACAEVRTGAPRAAMGLDGLPPTLDGKGTLIGVVDSGGIDLYHPDFVNARGRTRVRALWDQRAAPPAPRDSGGAAWHRYGCVYNRAELDQELAPAYRRRYSVVPHQAMKTSHGTATAGIAAGLGAERQEARGVAPGASLVFVDTFGSGAGALGAMTELADALRFIFDVADADDMPCAVNVSLGDNLGPRDGTSPVERFIDELLEEKVGRAVIVAAGNSAASRRHARVGFGAAREATIELDVGPGNDQSAVIEIWYERTPAGSEALEAVIEAPPDGGSTGIVPADGLPRAFDADGTRVLVASSSATPVGQNGLVRIEILPLASACLSPGIWKVHLHARGAVREAHAWIDHRYIRFAGSCPVEEETTITTPAGARRAITVGAYDLAAEKVWWFSGRGPGRGAAQKPDLLAPGGPLVTASAVTPRRYADFTTGTSVAAPLVTGAVALLFQAFGRELTREQILDLLAPTTFHRTSSAVPVATLAQLGGFAASDGRDRNIGQVKHGNHRIHMYGRQDMDHRNYVKPADVVQIWPGIYTLEQDEVVVGRLFVEQLSGPAHTKEHWLLYSSYRWPSETYPKQNITFSYEGAPGLLQDFLRDPPAGSAYIIASCDQQTLP
jgi:subtilisin family serine protease